MVNKYQRFQQEYYKNPYTRTQDSRPLDELVERATPKKRHPLDEYCPVCNAEFYNHRLGTFNFCYNCGTALEKSDEDE